MQIVATFFTISPTYLLNNMLFTVHHVNSLNCRFPFELATIQVVPLTVSNNVVDTSNTCGIVTEFDRTSILRLILRQFDPALVSCDSTCIAKPYELLTSADIVILACHITPPNSSIGTTHTSLSSSEAL